MAEKSPKVSMTTAPPPADKPDPKAKGKKKDENRDSGREIAETVVFVIVLVLMLKTFVAEAFVIPTGSMAETLYGYQRMVTCDQCGYEFPVNCSSEVDPQQGQASSPVRGCFCPNCANPIRWKMADAPSWSSGDRVLVAKFLYDRDLLWKPKRHQIIVFKYPDKPQSGTTAMNYIKRCEGEPEETLAIFDGDVYVTKFLKYEHRTPSENPLDRWRTKDGHDNMYRNDDKAITHFADSMKHRADRQPMEGDFQIIRKAPDVMLAMRRIVFNNDHQPKDLTAEGIRRWQMGNGWTGDDQQAPKVFTITPQGAEAPAWLTYAHLLGEKQYKKRLEEQVEAERQAFPRPPATPDKEQAAQYEAGKKMLDEIDRKEYFNVVGEFRFVDDRRLISNVMGYNTGEGDGNQDPTGHYWVSDLMLDLTVKVESGQGSFILELSKGIDRFRATFDVATGECVLQRRTGSTEEEQAKNTTELGRAPTALKAKGTYHVRFANFDERLTVWVDRKLPFGDGVEYPPAQDRKPTKTNDLAAPASVGATGASVSVSHLQLWRDTFYTHMSAAQRPKVFGEFRDVETMYVQPGHYLCLGDNSGSSADSRDWGLVPDRLLLGRALWVYFPFWPFNNRFGPIR